MSFPFHSDLIACNRTLSNVRYDLGALSLDLQIGVATVTCIAIWGAGETVLFMLGMKPESIPPVSFSQGLVKADCVAV
jgi:hypothetical protein